MMTFNIRSIRKHFKDFTNLLGRIQSKIHIICLTESWLGPQDNIDDFRLDGYHTPLYQNRTGNMIGGGVVTYVHKDIAIHKHIKHLSFVDNFNNCLATDVTINNKTITFLNIYRSPNNLNDSFTENFDALIDKVKNRTCYILGDLNYNLININRHSTTEEYYNNLISASFKPLIWKPTRITEQNSTLIDHIWTNDLRSTSYMKSHIIVTDISDHLPCVTVVTNPEINLKGYKTITKRILNDDNRLKFYNEINETKDILAFHCNNQQQPNIDVRFDDYIDHITRKYNNCFPLVSKKVHTKSFTKPWITPLVQKLIDRKNKKFSAKKKKKTALSKEKYKQSKIIMENEIDKEKTQYYKKILQDTNDNIKKRWNAIRVIINRKRIDTNHCCIPNELLGKHYEKVAPNLDKKLPKMTKNDIPSSSKHVPKCFAKNKIPFEFKPTSEREVYEQLLRLDVNKGPGIDCFDVKSIKSIANIISPHLATLFNLCISSAIYPKCLKVAKCIPVYKGNPLDPSLPINYRPISILTAINKVFERIIHNQLSKYLEENNLLPQFQYGYRKQHNTSQAIIDLTDHITQECARKHITIAIFMDLSKAFDTVNKSILEQKLGELGLNECSTALINSYVSDRKFCMNSDNKYYHLEHGVPQGSILGPLLFIMYIYMI